MNRYIPYNIYMTTIKRSGIDGAGVGVYAKQNFKKNVIITEYIGRYFKEGIEGRLGYNTWKEFYNRNLSDEEICFIISHQHYKCNVNDNIVIYGFKLPEILQLTGKDAWRYSGSLLNHSTEPNCIIMNDIKTKKTVISTNKYIKEGDELFVDYGKQFWEAYRNYEELDKGWKLATPNNEGLIEWFERQGREKIPVKGLVAVLAGESLQKAAEIQQRL